MGLIGTLLRKQPEPETVEQAEDVAELEAAPVLSGPPLIMLIPSVAGISSYRLQVFPDTASATECASSSFNAFQRSNIQAFWAMPEQPEASWASEEERRGEGLVLIREEPGSDVVYALSFVDIESAQAFVQFEVERGLNPGLAMIYWASLARLVETPEGVRLTPSAPPSRQTTTDTLAKPQPETNAGPEAGLHQEPATDTGHIEAIWPGASTFTVKPQDIRELEPEDTAALAHYELKDAERTGLLVEERPPVTIVAPEAAPDPQASALHEATGDLIAETAAFMTSSAPVAEEPVLASEPVAEPELPVIVAEPEETVPDPQASALHEATGDLIAETTEFMTTSAAVTEEPVLASEPIAELAPPDALQVEEMLASPALQGVAEDVAAESAPVIESSAPAEPPVVALEVQPEPGVDFAVQTRRLLRARRWEKRDEPFTGFRSPPGRF